MTNAILESINRFGDRMLRTVVPTIQAEAGCNYYLYPFPDHCPYGVSGSDPLYCFNSSQCYTKYSPCGSGYYTKICSGCNCSGCPCT